MLLMLAAACSNAAAQLPGATPKLIEAGNRLLDTSRNNKLTSIKTQLLAEVLQASITNGLLSASENDISLRSTLYGLKKLYKKDIATDINYARETFSRNFEIGLGIPITEGAKINGINTAITYALINKRDISLQDEEYLGTNLARKKAAVNVKVQNLVNELAPIADQVTKAVRSGRLSRTDSLTLMQALANFGSQQDKDFETLLQTLQQFEIPAPEGLKEMYLQQRTELMQMVDTLERAISKRALWTLATATSYQANRWDSIQVKTEYLKGLGWQQNANKPWDLYFGAFVNWNQDTVRKQALQRSLFSAKLGLNKVLALKRDGSSFIEILGAAEYSNLLRGRYQSEDQSRLMAAFTLTIRVSNSLFLPFDIRYDPSGGNVLGFLNVKWDFLRTSAKE